MSVFYVSNKCSDFFLTEKRRDAPNGKLLMIIDKKVFKLQFNYCRNVYRGLMLNIYDQIS